MRRKIPSTSALLAFEVAGRHESFSRAAEELAMTEGAVSRQIGRLEIFLGTILFNRVKGRVHLTEAGRDYWTQTVGDLNQIEWSTLRLRARPAEGGVLELAVIPTFTNKWIMPRLPEFHAQYPGITINMSERPDPFLFADSPFDASIHYNHPAWVGMNKVDLFAEELVPICSPKLLGGFGTPSLEQLKTLPLLHKRSRSDAWKRWWDHMGVTDLNPTAGAQYDLYSMAIEAAVAGLGMALVPGLYVTRDIEDGRLVIPCSDHTPEDKRYCVIYPDHKRDFQPLQHFLQWLTQEAERFNHHRTNSAPHN